MRPNQLPISKLQGRLYLAFLATLFLIMALFAGCKSEGPTNTQTSNQQNKTVQTQASPSPAPSIEEFKREPTDEPIIVKGGSVDVQFNDTFFKSDGSTDPAYKKDSGKIVSNIEFLDPTDSDPRTAHVIGLCNIPDKGNSRIIIHASRRLPNSPSTPGPDDKPITITSNFGEVEIRFPNIEYPNASSKPHYAQDKTIDRVEMKNGGATTQCTLPPSGNPVIRIWVRPS